LKPGRIEVEIGRLVVEDPALAKLDFAAALQRELVGLARTEAPPRGEASSPVSAVARQIYARLGR
jgi:hypothetical protein